MDESEARRLIKGGEGQQVEFKTSFAEQNEAVITLCAFAHADGGTAFFGVKDDGTIYGVQLGKKTLEDFSQVLRTNTEPQLYPAVEQFEMDGKLVVAATIGKAAGGELFHAFKAAYIRVGKTNEVMSSQEQKKRLLDGQRDWGEEHSRPRFAVEIRSTATLERSFCPEFRVSHFSGDRVPYIAWRLRGPRFAMDWEQVHVAMLDRVSLTRSSNISGQPRSDPDLDADQMGLEIAFSWRGEDRTELHRWPLTRNQHPTKAMWSIGAEILPSLER